MPIDFLYLCEKPSQARDIARQLKCQEKGEGYLKNSDIVVTWCFGHLLETAEPAHYCEQLKPWRLENLPVVPSQWQMVIKKSCRKQFQLIQRFLKETKTVVIATDADREGEVIAREILEFCQYKGAIKRLWLSALDDASIQKALTLLREGSSTEKLYQSGLGRQRADWLIGMNMTMAATVLLGEGSILSVGRVQTPTLALVVNRDKVIENFKSRTYYELIAQFTIADKQSFYAKWQPPINIREEEGHIYDSFVVNAFAHKVRGKKALVKKFEDQPKKQSAPLCLSLSQLQKLASSLWGFSAIQTLNLAQSLYETHKAITYPRTDCGYLPENQLSEAPTILNLLKVIHPQLQDVIDICNSSLRSLVWNDKKITAHHGIIPTQHPHVVLEKMSEQEKSIYDLVCRYYVAQFLGDYVYSHRSIIVVCEEEQFKASNNTPLHPGWKRALKNSVEKENQTDDEELVSIIPLLQENTLLQHTNEKLLTRQTKPPARFTEGTLIEAMKSISKWVEEEQHKKILKETAGIGTEATRAAIIETLIKREYIEKKAKQLMATEKGRKLVERLPPMVCDPILTAEWEQQLDQIVEGQYSLSTFLDQQNVLLKNMLEALGQSSPKTISTSRSLVKENYSCPQCSQILQRRLSKLKKAFWGCSNYPTCRFSVNDNKGIPDFKQATA